MSWSRWTRWRSSDDPGGRTATPQACGYGLGGLWLGGRRSVRTRYRPDPWNARACLVAASGAAVVALLTLAAARDPEALHPGVVPLAVGPAVLRALRRATRRAAFETAVTFDAPAA